MVICSISSEEDHGIHCWWDLIRSKQLSSVSICYMQVFAGFSGQGDSIHNISPLLKKKIYINSNDILSTGPFLLISFIFFFFLKRWNLKIMCNFSLEVWSYLLHLALCISCLLQQFAWLLSPLLQEVLMALWLSSNGIGNLSSNPEQSCLHFTSHYFLWKRYESSSSSG